MNQSSSPNWYLLLGLPISIGLAQLLMFHLGEKELLIGPIVLAAGICFAITGVLELFRLYAGHWKFWQRFLVAFTFALVFLSSYVLIAGPPAPWTLVLISAATLGAMPAIGVMWAASQSREPDTSDDA